MRDLLLFMLLCAQRPLVWAAAPRIQRERTPNLWGYHSKPERFRKHIRLRTLPSGTEGPARGRGWGGLQMSPHLQVPIFGDTSQHVAVTGCCGPGGALGEDALM